LALSALGKLLLLAGRHGNIPEFFACYFHGDVPNIFWISLNGKIIQGSGDGLARRPQSRRWIGKNAKVTRARADRSVSTKFSGTCP
jgi:hypothetical protein